MKSKLLLIAIPIIGLIACDDLASVKIDTTLTKNMKVDIVGESAMEVVNLKSATETGFPFYEVDTINLAENNDLKKYLDDIDELEVYKVSCKLNGIPEGEAITELTVFSNTAGLSVTITNITENNSSAELEISAAILKALGELLLQYEVLEVGVSGSSTFAPMTLSVELSFETTVKAGLF